MGNPKAALELIIKKLEDVDKVRYANAIFTAVKTAIKACDITIFFCMHLYRTVVVVGLTIYVL